MLVVNTEGDRVRMKYSVSTIGQKDAVSVDYFTPPGMKAPTMINAEIEYVDIFHRKHKTFSSFQIIAAVVSTGTAAHIVPGPVLNDKDY